MYRLYCQDASYTLNAEQTAGASIESENPEPEERSSGDQTGIINPNRTFNILCTLTQFKRKQENFSFLCHPDL